MAKMTSDFFVERLKAWGVKRIYGYPGDGINGVLGALQRAERAGDGIEFIQVRHEEMAAFMAAAEAKFSGEVGVCLSTGGPGATHLITGLYDAKLDHAPVFAIMGQAETSVRGASYQQELNLDRVFADVCEYVQEAAVPPAVRHVTDRALRIAAARNAVTAIVLPKDVQDKAWEEPAVEHGFTRSGPGYARPRTVPHDADLRRAAAVLNAGKKVAILIGAGARDAANLVVEAADLLGAGVAKALLGKDVLPDDLPFVTGAIGLLGTEPSSDMMEACDTLLMVGTGFPWAEFLPKDGAARAVQIDIEPAMLGLRYPTEVNLHGGAAETLAALMPLLRRQDDRTWREEIERGVGKWWKTLEARAMVAAKPINPQRIVWEMSPLLPDDAIVTSDSGSCANWYARDFKVRAGQRCSLSGGLASMGAAVPYAIGAKFAHPNRAVVALIGDGAMQMNCMAELITVAKLGAVGGSAVRGVRVQQPRSQRGDMGAADHGGQSALRDHAEPARRALCAVRGDDRPEGRADRGSGPACGRMARRVARGPAGGARRGVRPRRGAAAAARDAGPGTGVHGLDPQGRRPVRRGDRRDRAAAIRVAGRALDVPAHL